MLILIPSMTIIFQAFNICSNILTTDHSWKSMLNNKLLVKAL